MSDHSLVLLNTGVMSLHPGKHFQFLNHLMLLDGFEDCVLNAWSLQVHGNPFFIFSKKLKKTKQALKALNHSAGNLSTAVNFAKDSLHQMQSLLSSNPHDINLIEQEKSCLNHLWSALEREETLMQQKSRATWLSLGDKNSNFFFNMIKSRWNSNKILSIQNSAGDTVYGQEAVEIVVVDYFKDMFNSSNVSAYPGLEGINPGPLKYVSPDQAIMLSAPVTDSEIFNVVFYETE